MATELEQLEQAITRALQDIDKNITRCNKAVEYDILPALERYNRGSGRVWDKGGHFWMDFLEKASCVKFTTHEADLEGEGLTVEDPSMTEKVPLKQDSYEVSASELLDSHVQDGQQHSHHVSNLLSELDDSMDVSMGANSMDQTATPSRRSTTSTPRFDRHASSGRSKIPQPEHLLDYSLDSGHKTPNKPAQPVLLKHALESASRKYDHELSRAAKRNNYKPNEAVDDDDILKPSSNKTGFSFKPSFAAKPAHASGSTSSKSKPEPAKSDQPWYMNVDLDDSMELPSPPKLSSLSNWKPSAAPATSSNTMEAPAPTEPRSILRQRINDREYHVQMTPAKKSSPVKKSYSPFHPKKVDAASTPARKKLFTPQRETTTTRFNYDNFSDDESDMLSPPQLTTHVMQWETQHNQENANVAPPSARRERSPERAARTEREASPADFDYKSGHTPFAKTPLARRMDRERLQQRTDNLVNFGSPNKDIFGTAGASSSKSRPTGYSKPTYDMLSFDDDESFDPPDLSPPVTIKFDNSRLHLTPAKEGARRVVQGALRDAGGELDSDDSMGSF